MTLRRLGAALVPLAVLIASGFAPARPAADRHAVTGMVVSVDPAHQTFVASIEEIPGFMAAMTMPFTVKNPRELDGLVAGAVVAFTLVVDHGSSYAEGVQVRRYETVEQDPLTARRLSLMRQFASGTVPRLLATGDEVPDFHLIDEHERPVTLAEFRGKVVAINFMYTTCQLADYCLRIVNHFAVLQKPFRDRLGRDLIFLTITFDPERDTPDVLAHYAVQWKPMPDVWHFLTGAMADLGPVLDEFGVSAVPDDGLMDHTLHTVLVGRDGRVAANIEGNKYTTDQLDALIRAVLGAPTSARP